MRKSNHVEFRKTKIRWVDSLPYNWNEAKLKWLSIIYSGGTPNKAIEEYWENGTIPWINSGAVNQRIIRNPSAHITNEAFLNSSAKWIEKGSIVMALAGQGKTKGMVGILDFNTTCNQSMAAINPTTKINNRYLFYWLDANYENIRNLGGGDQRDGINLEIIGDILCPIPSLTEQHSIAAFLDRETARINTLIEKKKKLIELLKEKRTALITRAVTKGLNKEVRMKPSGIEWLGDIPELWEVKRLKYYTKKIGSGVTPKGGSEVYEDSGIPIFRSQNIHFAGLRLDDVAFISEEIHNSMSGSKVDPYDVLLNITGASIGRCNYYDGSLGEANVNQHVCIIRTTKRLNHHFLQLFLSSDSGQSQIFIKQVGTSREGLTFQDIKNFFIALPPVEEQIEITNYLQQRILKTDRIKENIDKLISKLIEYRTAIISAAVTGKIRVGETGGDTLK